MPWPKGKPRPEETKRKTSASVSRAYVEGRHQKTNLGKGRIYSEPYYVRIEKGLPIFCKVHGEHTNWRKHGSRIGDICCVPCSNAKSDEYHRINRLKLLAYQVKRRDKLTDISSEFLIDLLAKQNNRCALTNREFNEKELPTIDRINPALGYKKSNVQFVIMQANIVKSDISLDKFIEYCHLVAHRAGLEYGMGGC
jgi:hypothetical protein